MSDYEFWDELGNIFNAVVAYQRKTIEFNKRFVNPWIRMGTVFDTEDHNADTVSAYQKALEIDPDNASSWLGLGDAYFKMGSFEDAATAYRKALALDPKSGWALANLALTQATQQNYTEAINLYIKSLEIINDEKDRSMIWNRLGNAYRKVNDYENAFLAFQMADECEAALTEAPAEQAPAPVDTPVTAETELVSAEAPLALGPNMPMPEEMAAPETTQEPVESVQEVAAEETPEVVVLEDYLVEEQPGEFAAVVDDVPPCPEEVAAEAETTLDETVAGDQPAEAEEVGLDVHEVVAEEAPVVEIVAEETEPVAVEETQAEAVAETTPDLVEEAPAVEAAQPELPTETLTAVMAHAVETFADPNEFSQPTVVLLEESEPAAVLVEVAAEVETVSPSEDQAAVEAPAEESVAETPLVETEAGPEVQVEAVVEDEPLAEDQAAVEPEAVVEVLDPAEEQPVVATEAGPVEEVPQQVETAPVVEADAESNEAIIQEIVSLALDAEAREAAYEEFLQDSAKPQIAVAEEPAQEAQTDAVKAEFKVEPDTRNAHVWNELGNVYFNAGAYEDAIAAYNKAIELDGWFAWPYSNLALAYVQKERYTEAVLLYQRSIELFSNDKDKAVTWNRLGSVYRRLNDYDNAIASYQRADELDPNNATRALRSRFSLLGSFSTDLAPSFVS